MAKRNSMSAARRSRNRKHKPVTPISTTTSNQGDYAPAPESAPRRDPADLAKIISGERSRLIGAEAVLGCVAFALLYEDWLKGSDRPSFSDAVTAVQDLVSETVKRLASN